ncbi:MAG TPA: dihydrolipoamide acetyltransferase family protein [Xanthobacteraceae bacterium]|nr:dihydrolipoamide acetyltransferase family protein [Xanthobacteraceae bacterium]
MIDFCMPSLGADMAAGTLVEWLVKPGDHVKRGDVIGVVETEKGAIEVEVFNAGIVTELVAPVGTKVPVGTVLARLDAGAAERPGPKPADAAPVAATIASAQVTAEPIMAPVPVSPVAAPTAVPSVVTPPLRLPAAVGERVIASPAARRLAAERGVALDRLAGSGPGGAITLADVQAASAHAPHSLRPTAPSPAAPAARRRGFDQAAMRQAIAAAMSRSKREIPHYYLTQTVEVSAALARLERLNRDRAPPNRLLPAALLLRATALAVAKMPELNGFWEDGRFRPGDGVHVGWAIALRGGGLMAPAIRDADKRSLDELMAAMRNLVGRARTGGVRSSELTDPTITITSLGDRGAESVLPIIYPPQVAMVGFGRIVTRPWVVDNAIGPRPVISLTLAGDHRASDGHRGGLLLAEIERLLQEVETL